MQNISKYFNPEKDFLMLKEILEQQSVLEKLTGRFLDNDLNIINLDIPKKDFSKIFICASGTSKNAGEISKYIFESLLKIPTIVEYSSEFAHKERCITSDDLFIAISQSGNTGDSFEALKLAKTSGAYTIAVTNNPESKIHKMADYSIYIDAGVETSVAATKSFSAQLFILYMIAIYFAEKIESQDCYEFKKSLSTLSNYYPATYAQKDVIAKIAQKYKDAKSVVMVARGINSAATYEGALKLKECCYIDANGYPLGEFLHGYIAFVDDKVPVVAIVPNRSDNPINYELAINNLKKIKQERNASLVIIKSSDDVDIEDKFVDFGADFINIPSILEKLSVFLAVAALQIFTYELSLALNRNIDKPRSLTKCVDSE